MIANASPAAAGPPNSAGPLSGGFAGLRAGDTSTTDWAGLEEVPADRSWLLSQADAPSAAPGLAPEGARPGEPERAPAEPEFAWTLAPIRWGGDLGYQYRALTLGDSPRRLQHVWIANLKAASYLWQPWFAQLAGGIGVVASKERGGSDSGTASVQSPVSNSDSVVGNATLALLPISRFPFNAYFDRTDSQATDVVTRSDFTSTRYGAKQSYRTVDGMANYALAYDGSVLDSQAFSRDRVDAVTASANLRSGAQALETVGARTRSDRSDTGEGSQINRFYSRHNYRPGADLSVETLASTNGNTFRLQSGGGLIDSSSRFLQLNNFTTWRPAGTSPLYVTGGARAFRSETELDGARADAQSIGANAAAQYRLNRNTSLIGDVSLTRVSTSDATVDTSNLIAREGVGATYAADGIPLDTFLYLWNGSVNAANETGGQDGNRKNGTGQLGHSLTRVVALSPISSLNLGLGQTFSRSYDTLAGDSRTLSENASVSWRVAPDARTIGYVSLSGADSRTRGYNESDFQLVNFQATGQFQFDRDSTASANLTVQGTRQATPDTPAAGFSRTSSGNLSYQHTRAFSVPQLRYFAAYAANESQFKSRLLGDLDAPRERIAHSFEQRIEYFIGRLELRLSAREAKIDGERNRLLFFSVVRRLGDL